MKISTQDGPSRRWSKPKEITEIIWFIGHNWGYAYGDDTVPIVSITKDEAHGTGTRDWVKVTEIQIQPSYREVVASTGG